jgi:CRISPR/Cas system-associated protein Csm6
MKKVIVIIALILAPMLSGAQSIFDKYEDMKDVTSIVVTQKAFRMLATIDLDVDDPEAKEFMEMVKKITGLKVFTTGDEKISTDMKATVDKYLKSSDLEELMRIKDGEQTVKFYVKEGKDENHVKELLMFVTGLKELTESQDIEINGKKREIETVLLTLTGDIDLRQVSKITNQMDIPGGDQLKKADKNNND